MESAHETENDAIALHELCEYAELDTQSYSGRGMAGRQCLGVQCDSLAQFIAALLQSAREASATYEQLERTLESIEDALASMRQDSLGRNIIVYFPNLPAQADLAD